MTNNDILRRIRYTFNYTDQKMAQIMASTGYQVTPELINQWLKKEDDADYVRCSDREFSHYLNGLINEKRGKKEDGAPAKAEDHLNNNIILMKLKIALNLKTEDIIDMLQIADFPVSAHELTALFRRSTHQHYRECKDQLLRRFLMGMQLTYRDGDNAKSTTPDTKEQSQQNTQYQKSEYKPAKATKETGQSAEQKKELNNKVQHANYYDEKNTKSITYGEYANKVTVAKVAKKETKTPNKNKKRTISTSSFKWPKS